MATGAIVARILTQYSDKGSKQAQKDIKKLGADFDKFAKQSFRAFGLAAAASAAFATKIGVDAVQAAIADQKSQVILANSLRNTVGATDEAIAATEDYISAQQLLVGVSDTELRNSLLILASTTRSLTEAQALQNIALDVAASGYGDVESVSKALAKAYGGNIGALKRLVPGISATIVKTKDFDGAVKFLTETMGGAAAAAADTLEGRLRILSRAYDEIIESLGYALLPVVQEFAGYLLSDVLPRVQEWVDLNKDELAAGLRDAAGLVKTLLERSLAFGQWVTDNTGTIKILAGIIAGMFVANKVAAFIVALKTIIATMAILRTTAMGAAIATAFATAGVSVGTAAVALAAVGVTALVTKRYMDSTAKTTEKVTKSTKGLTGSTKANTGVTNSATTAITKYNTAATNTAKTTKTLTEEQKKAAEIQKKLKEQFGITTKEDDPIQLEAARLNLLKQQALGIEALTQNQYAFIEAQFASNVQAQRYADILAVINDNKISSTELDALAYKWGKSREFVLKYIQEVTGINNIVIGKDLGLDAANSWENAKKKLDEYLKSLQATGQVSPQTQAVISQIDQATADALAASDAALAAAERARKANEKFADAGIFPGAFPRSNPGDFRSAEERSNATGPIISTPTMGAVAGFTPTVQYGSMTSPGSAGFVGPTINVTMNAGNVIGSSAALVDTVRQGILAGQSSGNIISYNPLDI
jgi:hypothetical protein